MKKLLSFISVVLFFTVMFYPVSSEVEIIKSEITSNKPFAATINGSIVGTDVCVAYWLKPNEQPAIATYAVKAPLVLRYAGFTYNAEIKKKD